MVLCLKCNQIRRILKRLIHILAILGIQNSLFFNSVYAENTETELKIKACVDDKDLFPWAMFNGKKYSGMKFDFIYLAQEKLKASKNGAISLNIEITPLPWKRCLSEVELGTQDMVLLGSYSKERAMFADYPEGASSESKECTSPYRTVCDGYSILVLKDDPYLDYNGNPKTIPEPARATSGYSAIDMLEKQGVKTESSLNNEKAVLKMIRDKNGSAIVGLYNAPYFATVNKNSKNYVRILPTPYILKSYYYPISKKSKLTQEQKNRIWEALASIGQDKEQMDKLLQKYYHP